METSICKKLKKYSKMLKSKIIQNIIEETIGKCTLKNIEIVGDTVIAHLKEEGNNDNITLEITDEKIVFKRENKKELKVKTITQESTIDTNYYELRPNGVVIEKVRQTYGYSIFSKTEKKVTDLTSRRYILSTKTLNERFPEIDCMHEYSIGYLYREYGEISDYKEEILKPDMVTTFETHMKYCAPYDGVRLVTDSIYSTYTLLNGEDVSFVYDIVEGPDKLPRIYDLYNGIINDRNIGDLRAINLGLLREQAFGLKEASKITEKENSIVSKFITSPNASYYQDVCRLLKEKLNYDGVILLDDREALLKAIKHKLSAVETSKRTVERMLGIPYQEFEQLDIDEQHKLIEAKSGKKLTPDKTKYMDCVPVDQVKIYSDSTQNGDKPKSILKTIFGK